MKTTAKLTERGIEIIDPKGTIVVVMDATLSAFSDEKTRGLLNLIVNKINE